MVWAVRKGRKGFFFLADEREELGAEGREEEREPGQVCCRAFVESFEFVCVVFVVRRGL
jgi:hypothetical protein